VSKVLEIGETYELAPTAAKLISFKVEFTVKDYDNQLTEEFK
jgi:hypothetical protein